MQCNDMEFPGRLTHFDCNGSAVMVDVTGKNSTHRIATAKGKIKVNSETFEAICRGTAKKGDVLGVARVAGIMAAKKTPELIPLCHPLMLMECTVDFSTDAEKQEVEVVCTVKVTGQTGVEMEALTGVSISLLTIYDMCKAIDKSMKIGSIRLVRKSGGKSGEYINPNEE